MSKVEDFLLKSEEDEIIQAIKQAEKSTSGEIRVHIESHSKDYKKRVVEVFHKLEMTNTKDRNGVLLYIAVKDKYFHIYGDEGIDNVVSDDFWNSSKDVIITHFKKKEFKIGIINTILEIGKQLKQYFPYDASTDTNELPDEISYS